MKLSKVLLATSLLAFALTGCTQDKTAIMKINDTTITKADYQEVYDAEANNAENAMYKDYLKDENSLMSLMLRDRIVNELILKALLEQEIAKHNITVTSEEIEKRKAEIVEKIGSKEKVNELLKQNGISEKRFNEDVEKELKLDKLVNSLGKGKVTDKDVKDFYNKNKAMFNFPERVRASHILIEVNPAAIKQEIVSEDKKGELTSEEINKRTQEIVDNKMNFAREVRAKAVKNPENFAALAKQYSDDKASAQKGGDLGFFDRKTMVKPFADAAFKLKPGTVSEIVVTDYGNHIIIVTDKSAAGVQPFEKAKDDIKAYLTQKAKVESLDKLLEGLKASAKIEYIDSKYDINNIQKEIKEKAKEQEKMIQEEAKKEKASK